MSESTLETGFIGAGNMGQALIAGLIRAGMDASNIGIAEPDSARARDLLQRFPGLVLLDAGELAGTVRTLVLAVKPQVLPHAAPDLAPEITRAEPLVVSIAAGITTTRLAGWLGPDTRIIRAMPNTPALVGAGIAGLYANPRATAPDRQAAERLLGSVGETIWVEHEDLMHAVTATSGSGPAYVFLLIEAMEAAATRLGLDPLTAHRLTLATVSGAARLAAESPESPTQLRVRVTSPGGTTERAIDTFQDGDFAGLVDRALQSAAMRSRELGE
ncbi:Pyrroline-5-carboxylate reductase [Thioalkalivibrio nitratireducens DSM 14787]|uniref:Pyrroline-5-carboxylate reductase n=1 Tax=Thioalkalivibrio nitratireducens (strain DSM 14787 / UNIQEM 213 / ALEN2) TaxID=1255043 RepID=L0DSM2_THIND|nr:pyrroline-5-carboxylate reductase [Thioalkalivibrio nitratireducens]AGA32008.1 Pyrroline-5-carboxylate reductase [Thioalkalivibrio nitratireducens DSM 14787]